MGNPRCWLSPVLAAVLLLTGCATLPDSGPVRERRDLQLERENSGVRPIGQPPAPRAPPEEIVLGFLRAGADFSGDHHVARQYLAPSIRQRWRPGAGTVLYDRAEAELSVTMPRKAEVAVTGAEVARIDKDGKYTAAQPRARVERNFRLARVAGQWRISALDDGLLLSRGSVPDIYRQFNLYFLAPTRKVLVPDPVFLPVLPGLSTKLVTRLLRGPTSALRGAVTSGFPDGTALAVSSVPIRDGVATVPLDATAGRADETERELMSAQLVWTLKQLPDFRFLRVTIDDEPLGLSGVGELQARGDWGAYDPTVIRENTTPYIVREGRAGRLLDKEFVPLAALAGEAVPAVRSVAISLDLTRAAAVSVDGASLLVAPLAGRPRPTVRVKGSDLSRPSWDALGNVWVVEQTNGRLWVVPPGDNKPTQVAAEAFEDVGIPAGVRVARDGARVALIMRRGGSSRLYVAAVVRENDGSGVQVTALREVRPELRDVRDVAWIDATEIITIAQLGDAADTPLTLDIAGYELSLIKSPPGLLTIAAAPPHPIVAGTHSGRVQRYDASGEWQQIGPGSNPTYPG